MNASPSRLFSSRDAALLRLARAVRDLDYRFVTVSPATHARVNARAGSASARDLPGVFGWSRPFTRETLPSQIFDLMGQADVIEPHGDAWRSRVRISSLDDQLFLHSAFPTEAADAVFFGPDTYRFARAIRAMAAQRQRPVHRALELCCGAAPGGVLMALAWPDAQVMATDINDAALALAAVNAELAGAANLHAQRSDLYGALDGRFDVIVANPPYLNDAAGRAYRHGGGALGEALALRIVREGVGRLAPGGTLLLYTGVAMLDGCDPFLATVRNALAGSSMAWHYEELDPDVFGEELDEPAYAHVERIAAVTLAITAPTA